MLCDARGRDNVLESKDSFYSNRKVRRNSNRQSEINSRERGMLPPLLSGCFCFCFFAFNKINIHTLHFPISSGPRFRFQLINLYVLLCHEYE